MKASVVSACSSGTVAIGYGVRCEAYHPTAPEPEGRAVAALIEDTLVVRDARALRMDCAMSTSLAFGGNDEALVMRKV